MLYYNDTHSFKQKRDREKERERETEKDREIVDNVVYTKALHFKTMFYK